MKVGECWHTNKVLFETSYIGSLYGVLNIIITFGISLFLYFRFGREGIKVITIFLAGFLISYVFVLFKGYMEIVIPYKNGHYIEIEGKVENYVNVKGTEYFTVGGVTFECSGGLPWNYTSSSTDESKSIIASGQHIRIRYIPDTVGNVIVYIEQLMPEEWETD